MDKFVKKTLLFCIILSGIYAKPSESSSSNTTHKIKIESYQDYLSLAKYYLSIHADSTIYFAQLLLTKAKNRGDQKNIGYAHDLLGKAFGQLDNTIKSLEHHIYAKNVRQKLGNKQDYARSLHNIAYSHYHLYSYEQAIAYYQRALKLSNDINFSLGAKSSLQNLAFSYRDNKQLDSAAYFYTIYMNQFVDSENLHRQAKAHNDLGIIYKKSRQYELAEKHYLKSLELANNSDDEFYRELVYINLAYLYRAWNNPGGAMEYSLLALEQIEQQGNKERIHMPYYNLGALYLDHGNNEDAASYLTLAANHANMSNGNYEDLKDIYHAQAEVFDRLDRRDEALTARRNEENIKAMLAEQNSNQEQQRKAAEELERRLAEEGQTATTPIWFMALLGGGALIALLGIGYMARKLQPAYVTADSGQQTTAEDRAWSKKEYKVAFAQLTREKNQLSFQVNTLASEKAEVISKLEVVQEEKEHLEETSDKIKLELGIAVEQKDQITQQLLTVSDEKNQLVGENEQLQTVKTRLEREKEAIQRDHAQMKAEFNKMKATLQAAGSSKADAQALIDAIEEKMAKIIHDLKSPISSSQRLSEIIRKKIKTALEEDKRLAMSMKMLDTSLGKAIELVEENLLALANSHAQNKEAEAAFTVSTEFDLTGLITEIAAQNEGLLQQKKLTLHLEKNLVELLIKSVRQHIDRIVQNLLSNAIKFSPEGKNIYLGLEKVDENNVRIWIKDEGPGMSEEDRKKLYNSFQTLTAKSTAGESSTGLGTSIVAELVQELGGKIECESELGVGTTFYVTLPIG